MIESWMVGAGIAIAGVVGAYSVTKYKADENKSDIDTVKNELNNTITDLKADMKEHDNFDVKHHEDINKRVNAAFKRIDEVSNDVIILQRDTANHLDMGKAEVKFVSKEELALHMKNIDIELAHINENSKLMVGKLDDLTKAFSHYMLRQVNGENDD